MTGEYWNKTFKRFVPFSKQNMYEEKVLKNQLRYIKKWKENIYIYEGFEFKKSDNNLTNSVNIV